MRTLERFTLSVHPTSPYYSIPSPRRTVCESERRVVYYRRRLTALSCYSPPNPNDFCKVIGLCVDICR